MRLLFVTLLLLNVTWIITDPGTVNGSAPTQEPKAEAQAAERRAEVERLNEQVDRLINEAKFDEALPLANRAWEISKAALGPTDTVVANAATNLAALHIAKGNRDRRSLSYCVQSKLTTRVDVLLIRW